MKPRLKHLIVRGKTNKRVPSVALKRAWETMRGLMLGHGEKKCQ